MNGRTPWSPFGPALQGQKSSLRWGYPSSYRGVSNIFDVFSPAVYCSGYVSCKGEARTNKGNVLVNQENKYEEIGNTVFSLPFSPVQLAISMFCFPADGNLSGTLRYS